MTGNHRETLKWIFHEFWDANKRLLHNKGFPPFLIDHIKDVSTICINLIYSDDNVFRNIIITHLYSSQLQSIIGGHIDLICLQGLISWDIIAKAVNAVRSRYCYWAILSVRTTFIGLTHILRLYKYSQLVEYTVTPLDLHELRDN